MHTSVVTHRIESGSPGSPGSREVKPDIKFPAPKSNFGGKTVYQARRRHFRHTVTQFSGTLGIAMTMRIFNPQHVFFMGAVASLVSVLTSCPSQSNAQSSLSIYKISVRVVDSDTGTPVKGIWVPLSELSE